MLSIFSKRKNLDLAKQYLANSKLIGSMWQCNGDDDDDDDSVDGADNDDGTHQYRFPLGAEDHDGGDDHDCVDGTDNDDDDDYHHDDHDYGTHQYRFPLGAEASFLVGLDVALSRSYLCSANQDHHQVVKSHI